MTWKFCLSLAMVGAMWAQAPANTQDAIAAGEAAAKAAAEKGAAEKARPPAADPTPGQPVAVEATPGSAQSIPLAQMANILALSPEIVIATIDGVKVTAGDLQAILRSLPPQIQKQALAERRQFLTQYGMTMRLAADAEKDKLPERSPWKEQLATTRLKLLAELEMQYKFNQSPVSVDEMKQFYETNKDRYTQAKVKAIYIPFTSAPVSQADSSGKKLLTEGEAKTKVDELLVQARGGADFGKLAKENSGDLDSAAKNGDFGVIHKGDRVPDAVKSAVFAGRAGDVVGPVRQANGFYLFRIEESGPQLFAELQQSIDGEIRNARFYEWYTTTQKTIVVKEEAIGVQLEVVGPESKPGPWAPSAAPSSAPAKK